MRVIAAYEEFSSSLQHGMLGRVAQRLDMHIFDSLPQI
jgi:hypothetical protein